MLSATRSAPSSHALVVLCQNLLRCGDAELVADVWSATRRFAVENGSRRLNSLAVQSLALCVDRARSDPRIAASPSLLSEIWAQRIRSGDGAPNVHCLALTALAFSMFGDAVNQKMARRLLSALTASEAMTAAMRTNPLSLIQSLSAMAHCAQSERAWAFYEAFVAKHRDGAHDATALLALAAHANNSWSARRALRTVEAHFAVI